MSMKDNLTPIEARKRNYKITIWGSGFAIVAFVSIVTVLVSR